MSNKSIVKVVVHDYFIIFASCIMFVVLLNPDHVLFTSQDLRNAMLCSLAASLPTLILYYPRECSERYAKIRIILHFAVVEAVVYTFASVMNWADGFVNKMVMVAEVAIIYGIIKIFAYRGDKKTADQINEKLKQMRQQEKDG